MISYAGSLCLQTFSEDFVLGELLGSGGFATTFAARSMSNGTVYACKRIEKSIIQCREDANDVRREVQIMKHLGGHQSIPTLHAVYEDNHYVYLVMNKCSGGDLFYAIFRRISRGELYSESDAARYMRTIITVVAYCHSMGVIHRDLKPENFLLTSEGPDADLVCTDFGLSSFFKRWQTFHDDVGTETFKAPEIVLGKRYGKEVDIWACGVILYIMLFGEFPPTQWKSRQSRGVNSVEIAQARSRIRDEMDQRPGISMAAKDCILHMLEINPHRRATADAILTHQWMREKGVASTAPLDDAIVSRLQQFAAMNRLQKKAMFVIANSMTEDDIQGLRSMFESFDSDNNGTITAEELRQALHDRGLKTENIESVKDMLSLIDSNANGTIEYQEFLAATVSRHQIAREEHLRAAFRTFDINGDGFISREEVKNVLSEDREVLDSELDKILEEWDLDQSGAIDYNEFCIVLTNRQRSAARLDVENRMAKLSRRMNWKLRFYLRCCTSID